MRGDGVRVRPAAVAGRFYPGDPDALAALVDALLAKAPPSGHHRRPAALVAPHAGFRFSGPVAAAAYAHLALWRGDVTRVIVLGPAHFTPLHGMALPSVEAFDTPLGPIPVDADARGVAAGLSGVVIDDEPHASEHAIETQLPFLTGGVPVCPLSVGGHGGRREARRSTLLGAPGTGGGVSGAGSRAGAGEGRGTEARRRVVGREAAGWSWAGPGVSPPARVGAARGTGT